MNKSQIYIVTSELHGGSAFYVAQLASIAASDGYQVTASFYPNGRSFEAQVSSVASSVVPLKYRYVSIVGFFSNLLTLGRAIRRDAPSVIYTNTVFPMLCIALLRVFFCLPRRTRVVHTLHSVFVDRFAASVQRKLATIIEYGAGLCVDKVIAPSEYMRQIGEQIYGSAKIVLIKNSLSERLQQQLLDVRRLRAGRGVNRPVTLLFVGRADRQKGLDVLLPAFDRIKSLVEVRLVLAGITAEELQAKFGSALRSYDGIECLGWVKDTANLYASADVFVMPSRWEAFGLTLLEARIAGVPCVGSNVDAIPELIPPASGVTVVPGDVDALVAGIMNVLGRLPDFRNDATVSDLPLFATHKKEQLTLLASLSS
jgi:glycosyltransferase involved in cell wall biosynthesis